MNPYLVPGLVAVLLVTVGIGVYGLRFTRGERATGGGTGLGLAIARWVVQLHRGSIAVVDPDGDRGCHIQVRLPLHRA